MVERKNRPTNLISSSERRPTYYVMINSMISRLTLNRLLQGLMVVHKTNDQTNKGGDSQTLSLLIVVFIHPMTSHQAFYRC